MYQKIGVWKTILSFWNVCFFFSDDMLYSYFYFIFLRGGGRRRQEFSKLNFASFWSFFDGCFHLVFLGSLAWSSAILLWTFLFHPLNTSDQSVDIPPENVRMSLVTCKKEFFFFPKGKDCLPTRILQGWGRWVFRRVQGVIFYWADATFSKKMRN